MVFPFNVGTLERVQRGTKCTQSGYADSCEAKDGIASRIAFCKANAFRAPMAIRREGMIAAAAVDAMKR
jgi:hypothetical protein